jgi:hypothetical protein
MAGLLPLLLTFVAKAEIEIQNLMIKEVLFVENKRTKIENC